MRTAARTSIVLILLMSWATVAADSAAAQSGPPPPQDFGPPPGDFGPPPDDFYDDIPPPPGDIYDDIPPPPDDFYDDFGPPPDDFYDDIPPPPGDFYDDIPPGEEFLVEGDVVFVEVFSDDVHPGDPFGGGLPPDVPPEYAFFVDPTLPVPTGFEWLDDPTLPVPTEYAFLYDPTLPVPAEFEWLVGPPLGAAPVDLSDTPEQTPAPRPTVEPTAASTPEPTSVGVAELLPAEQEQNNEIEQNNPFEQAVRNAVADRDDATPQPDTEAPEPSGADGESIDAGTAAIAPEQDTRPTSIDWQLPAAGSTDEAISSDRDAADVAPNAPALVAADAQPVRVVTGAPVGMPLPLLVFVALASAALVATIPAILRRRPTGDSALRELALTDDLTKLANRRRLDRDLASHRRGGRPIAVAMVDIDHFKKLNDEFGHATGDRVLQVVAEALAENIRRDDIVYRYGGEEFCILLPDTSEHEAAAVVDRVRRVIEELRFDDIDRPVTISAGVAESGCVDTAPATGIDRTLVEQADTALYAAKNAGRNRVALSSLSAKGS